MMIFKQGNDRTIAIDSLRIIGIENAPNDCCRLYADEIGCVTVHGEFLDLAKAIEDNQKLSRRQ